MQLRPLGTTDLSVSVICLGTMTWGEQNDEAEAHEQMDYAVSQGVNFFDTAELYPVPPKAETQGRTDEIIGTWFAKCGKRDDIILASKVTGRSEGMSWFRGGARLSKEQIIQACNDSLKRLQTDYIDLYQLHWPERSTNYFGKLGYTHTDDDDAIALETSLEALDELVKAGKVRHIGLSNETPWGMLECLRLAEQKGLPRIMSVQNPYNLLNRTYEIGMAEISIREQCGLLAYSPLAFGVLTGKYLGGNKPEGARLTLFDRFQRYTTEKAERATERYVEIAQAHNLDPAQMALAYVNQQPFLTSNIIGATSLEQLKTNIASAEITLSDEMIQAIQDVHNEHPNPCP